MSVPPLAPGQPSVTPKPRRLRFVALCLIGIVVVGAGGVAIKKLAEWREQRHLIADLRARGEPITFAELVEQYQPAGDEPDATDAWLEALATVGDAVRKAQDGDSSVEEFFSVNADAIARLHMLAAGSTRVRFPLRQDPETGFVERVRRPPVDDSTILSFGTLPMDDIEATVSCLCVEAGFQVGQDHHDAAARSLLTAFAVANTLDDVPTIVGVLERSKYSKRVITTLKSLLPKFTPLDSELAPLQAQLGRIDGDTREIPWAFRGEMVSGLAGYDVAWGQGDWLFRCWFYNTDKVFFINSMQLLATASELPGPELRQLLGRIDDDMRQHHVAKSLLPSSILIFQRLKIDIAAARVALLAVAATRFERAHGKPPTSLEQLVPEFLGELPSDPLYDKDFEFQRTDGGILIFSRWGESKQHHDPDRFDQSTGLMNELLYRSAPLPPTVGEPPRNKPADDEPGVDASDPDSPEANKCAARKESPS